MSEKIKDIQGFIERYKDEKACYELVARMKWPEGYRCARCGHDEARLEFVERVYECKRCGKQESVTSGTIFEYTKLPLWKWFMAIWFMVGDKRGISAMRLSKYIDVTYVTAWRMLHKLRMVMHEGGEEWKKLEGVIELDDAFFGGKGKGKRGRGAEKKVKVLVAVESRGDKAGRVLMRVVEHHDKGNVQAFALEGIHESSHIKTDNASVYNVLKEMGFEHESTQTLASLRIEEQPWVHRMISLAKRFVLGTYHGVSKAYFQRYLDEFCYRMNRRYDGKNIIMRFIADCVHSNPVRISEVSI